MSAVSQHMNTLEKSLGIALFERHSRGITPTEAGLIAQNHADEVFDSLTAFSRRIDQLKQGSLGTLVCGVFPTLATSIGPALLSSPEETGVRLQLRSARLVPLRRMLRQREVDVAFTWSYPWNTQRDEGFDYVPVLRDPTVLLVPSSDSNVFWSELMKDQTTWVTRSNDHQIGAVLDWAGREYGFSPQIAYSANDWAEAQSMVAAGVGVAFAPTLSTMPLRPGVAIIPVPNSPDRTIFLSRRKGQPEHPGEKVLVRRLRSVAEGVTGLAAPQE